jgi:predicted DNA-binding WGR domain protein
MVFLTRIDPARQLQQFWLSMMTPTLLGGWLLVREWGRIGSPRTVQARSFDSEDEARRVERQGIRKRGAPRLSASPRCCVTLVGDDGGGQKYSRARKTIANQVKTGKLLGCGAAGPFRLLKYLKNLP